MWCLLIQRSWVQILSHPALDGNDVKAMPRSIATPNPGSFMKNKDDIGSQMGLTKKTI